MPKAFVFNDYGGPQVQSFVDLPKPGVMRCLAAS